MLIVRSAISAKVFVFDRNDGKELFGLNGQLSSSLNINQHNYIYGDGKRDMIQE